ncbi:hypothetical protein P4560_20340, partial [Heyndrickxia sporothermodurans]|nr:hypothetical protein [Heyndrickxia sporothermodurans]
ILTEGDKLFPKTSENWRIASSFPRFFVSRSGEKASKKHEKGMNKGRRKRLIKPDKSTISR